MDSVKFTKKNNSGKKNPTKKAKHLKQYLVKLRINISIWATAHLPLPYSNINLNLLSLDCFIKLIKTVQLSPRLEYDEFPFNIIKNGIHIHIENRGKRVTTCQGLALFSIHLVLACSSCLIYLCENSSCPKMRWSCLIHKPCIGHFAICIRVLRGNSLHVLAELGQRTWRHAAVWDDSFLAMVKQPYGIIRVFWTGSLQ